MNLINFIDDNSIKNLEDLNFEGWNVRQAVRAILFNDKNQIALMHIGAYNVYKLPGGGFEEGEDLNMAFDREMMEETGCETEKTSNLGIFIEKRDEWKMIHVLYCYLAKVLTVQDIQLDSAEQSEDFSLHWIDSIDEAIDLVALNSSGRYDDKYIRSRDLSILKFAKEFLIKN